MQWFNIQWYVLCCEGKAIPFVLHEVLKVKEFRFKCVYCSKITVFPGFGASRMLWLEKSIQCTRKISSGKSPTGK